MARNGLCKVCGTPKRFAKEHEWLSDGSIVQRENPEHRMVFIETENISRTFSGVEDIIDMSIERIIIEAKRRATFDFVDHTLSGLVKTIVRAVGVRPVARSINRLGLVMGYGAIRIVSLRRIHGKGDFITMSIKEPYSIPLFCGDLAGAFEAVTRREVAVTYIRKEADEYEVTGHISSHPIELQDRLRSRKYSHKPGDIALEKCPKCGAPIALSEYVWYLDRGLIEHRERGRRMAMVGPAALDAIIDDLQEELGETIPSVIVEAQRRFIKTGFYGLEAMAPAETLRQQLALRGFGNLREVEWLEDRLRIRLENSCLHPVIVGVMLGVFELASGGEGKAEWSVSDDGGLVVEVSSAGSARR